MNKKILTLVIGAVLFSVVYRVMPYRPDNFNPLLALTLFGGFVFANDKKWAFIIPVVTMLLSDVVYQLMYVNGLGSVKGFYGWWQVANYASLVAMSFIGFKINAVNIKQIGFAGTAAAVVFFILSNFFVWAEGMGYQHSYSFSGLMQCYTNGLPFFRASLTGTLLFSTILFSSYSVIYRTSADRKIA